MVNTILLLMSSVTITLSMEYIKYTLIGYYYSLISTLLFNIVFSYYQLFEYKTSLFSINDRGV